MGTSTVIINLNDLNAIRRLVECSPSIYCQVHPITKGVSLRTYSRDGEKGKRRKAVIFISPRPPLTPSSPKEEIERVCELLGAPPPWLTKPERKAWKIDWRSRNKLPKKARGPKTRVYSYGRKLEEVAAGENAGPTVDDDGAGDAVSANPSADPSTKIGQAHKTLKNRLSDRPEKWTIPHAWARSTSPRRNDDKLVRLMEQARRNIDRERSRKR